MPNIFDNIKYLLGKPKERTESVDIVGIARVIEERGYIRLDGIREATPPLL